MCDLVLIVVPKIKAEWEDLAYALHFEALKVDAIKENGHHDPKKCCRELLKVWINTELGIAPKTWSMLLEKIKRVEELASAANEIFEALCQEYIK